MSENDSVKLPAHIKVLGKKFKVKDLTSENDEGFEDCEGYMDYRSQEIAVRTDVGLGYSQDTLLHEVIHAVEESLDLRFTEKQVFQLAAGLLGVLKENKEFTDWLLQNE